MKATMRAVLCALLLGAGLAAAQEPGQQAPDLPLPKDRDRGRKGKEQGETLLQTYRNRIIVLVYFDPKDHRSVKLLPRLFELSEKYRQRGVLMVWLTRYKKEAADDVLEDLLAESPGSVLIYYGVNPERPYRFPVAPLAYIVDKFGRVAWARFDPTDVLEEKIQEVMKRTPPINATPERTKEALARVSRLLQEGKPGAAYAVARELQNVFRDEDEATEDQIEDLLKQVRAVAQQTIETAEQEIDKEEYAAACEKLAELSVRLADVKVEKDKNRARRSRRSTRSHRSTRSRRSTRSSARSGESEPDLKTFEELKDQVEHDIGRLQGDNYTKTIIRKALDNVRGEVRNERAAALAAAGYLFDARELYRRVTEDFPGTEAARAAQAALDQMDSDPAVRAKIEKQEAAAQAARWYDLGDRFARAELFDEAREYLQKVIDEYPDSAAANKARARLKRLPEEKRRAEELRARRAAAARRPTPEGGEDDED